jgi:hypothetical protein
MNRPRARDLAANHRRQYINNMPNNLTPSANRLPESKRARLSNKLKSALDDMVWNGAPFDEAARAASYSVQSMRKALNRRHVLRYLREQKQVMRESVSAGNILTLREIRDRGSNDMARVKSVQVLEAMGDVEHTRLGSGEPSQPGLTIQIITSSPGTTVNPRTIEHEPARRGDDDEG